MGESTQNAGVPKCPYCGSQKVVKSGIRNRRKGPAQRWLCDGGHRFLNEVGLHSRFSEHEFGDILDLVVEGFSPAKVAKLVGRDGIRVSKQSVANLVCRMPGALAAFEHDALNVLKSSGTYRSSILYIDDMWVWISRIKDEHATSMAKDSCPRYLRRYVWVTNTLDRDSRYWPAFFVSSPRIFRGIKKSEGKLRGSVVTQDVVNKIIALGIAPPVEIRCDGHRGHIYGAVKALRHTPIIYRTKKQNKGFINYIERLNRDVRQFLNGLGKLRNVSILSSYLELYRTYYNFLRPHMSLNGSTPARALGIQYPNFKGFEDLLKYAHGRYGHSVP